MGHGLIALDIDGTLTAEWHTIPDEVAAFLQELQGQGWVIVLITGRPYRWAQPILNKLLFPLYVALQNGAIILKWPEKNIVQKRYLGPEKLGPMEKVCAEFQTDFVVYTGLEHDDRCYYRSSRFSYQELDYMKARAEALEELYINVKEFEKRPYPSYKCFANQEMAGRLARRIREELGLYAPVIIDRFNQEMCVVQVTARGVDKGQALSDCLKICPVAGKIIAAGDDSNDVEMLQKADIKIVMNTAPQEILALADIIAPSADEQGIIEGLKKAVGYA